MFEEKSGKRVNAKHLGHLHESHCLDSAILKINRN